MKRFAVSIRFIIVSTMVCISVLFMSIAIFFMQNQFVDVLTNEHQEQQRNKLAYIGNNIQQFAYSIAGYARTMMVNPSIIEQINNFRPYADFYTQTKFIDDLSLIAKNLAYSQPYIVTTDILVDGLSVYKKQLNGVFDYNDYPDSEVVEATKHLYSSGWVPTHVADLPIDVPDVNIISYIQGLYSDLYSGEKIGHLVINIYERELLDLIDQYAEENNAIIILLDEKNNILSSNQRDIVGKNIEQTLYLDFDTENNDSGFIFSIYELPNQNWRLVSVLDYASVIAPVDSLVFKFRIMTIITILLLAVILSIIATTVSSPIIKLASKMESADVNDLDSGLLEIDTGIKELNIMQYQYNNLFGRLKLLVRDIKEKEEEKRRMTFDALQEQINPHFLYNTLETINWMALSNGQKEIGHIVQLLGSFFRLSLNKGKYFYCVSDEIEHARSYIEIQKIRLYDQIDFECVVDPSVLDCITIKILLQPFLENSIIHGFDGKSGKILLEAKKEDGYIEYIISDNGKGISPDVLADLNNLDSDVGHGIKNVMKRVFLYYGVEGCIRISSEQRKGTVVHIRIPLSMEESLV